MPQMMPMYWMLILLFSLTFSLTIMMTTYFLLMPNMTPKAYSPYSDPSNNQWPWMW